MGGVLDMIDALDLVSYTGRESTEFDCLICDSDGLDNAMHNDSFVRIVFDLYNVYVSGCRQTYPTKHLAGQQTYYNWDI
jgi:hypothetical protein